MSDTDQSCNTQMQAAAGSPPTAASLEASPAGGGIRDRSNGASACRSFSLQPPRDLPQILHAFASSPAENERQTYITLLLTTIPQPQQPTRPPARRCKCKFVS